MFRVVARNGHIEVTGEFSVLSLGTAQLRLMGRRAEAKQPLDAIVRKAVSDVDELALLRAMSYFSVLRIVPRVKFFT